MNKIFRICISLNLIRASDSESTHCKVSQAVYGQNTTCLNKMILQLFSIIFVVNFQKNIISLESCMYI